MFGSRVVVAAMKDVATEVTSRGNKDVTLIGKYSIGMLPIGETGVESGGNGSIHGLESLKNERIRGRRGGDTGG